MKIFFSEIFIFLSIPQVVSALLNLMFACTYHPNVSVYCYKPSMVFKNFDVSILKNDMDNCICHSSRRFARFLDKETCGKSGEGLRNKEYVRTMDLNIVQYKWSKHAIKMSLHQIPLRPTFIFEAIQVVFDDFLQVCQILNIEHLVDMEMARIEVRSRCRRILLEASKLNKFGFMYSQPFLFNDNIVNNELNWLLEHIYIYIRT
jgi:hypothetical protein